MLLAFVLVIHYNYKVQPGPGGADGAQEGLRAPAPPGTDPGWGLGEGHEGHPGKTGSGSPGKRLLELWVPGVSPPGPGRAAAPGSARLRYYYFVIYSLIYSFIKCLLSSVQM